MISYSEINRCQVNTSHFNPSCRGDKYASCTGGESTSKENNIMEKNKKIENKSHDKLVIENTMEPKIKHRKILF